MNILTAKIITWMLTLIMAIFSIENVCSQNQNNLNDIVKKVKNNSQRNVPSGGNGSLVNLTKDNCSEIEIYKDGINNTSTGHAFHIHISRYKTIRHAGEWDGLCGVVDTYYNSDTTLINKAIKLINQAQIYEVDRKKPLVPSKGTTQIKVFLGDILCCVLNASPAYRNYKGDFHKLVNQLVGLTGGEPDFGGPLVPYSNIENYEPEIVIDTP